MSPAKCFGPTCPRRHFLSRRDRNSTTCSSKRDKTLPSLVTLVIFGVDFTDTQNAADYGVFSREANKKKHIFSVCCPGVLFGEMVVDFGQIVQEPLICVLFGPPQHTHSPKNCHRAAHMQLRRREGARRNYGRKIMSLLKKRVGRANLMCKIAHSCGSPVARGGEAFPGGGTPKPRMVHT